MKHLLSHKTEQGFTLTEIAIVLAVFGLVFAALWKIAPWGTETSKQQRASQEIFTIVRDVRAFYAGQMSIGGGVATVVPTLVNAGAVSSDMVRTTGGCSNTYKGTTACLDNPWGVSTATTTGSFQICGWIPGAPGAGGTSNCVAGATGQQFFSIELIGLSAGSCVNLVVNNSGSTAPPGLVDIVFNHSTSVMSSAGPSHQLPVRVQDANTYCAPPAAGTAAIDFIFRLVPPQS